MGTMEEPLVIQGVWEEGSVFIRQSYCDFRNIAEMWEMFFTSQLGSTERQTTTEALFSSVVYSKNIHLTIFTLPTCHVLRFFSYPILIYVMVGLGVGKEKAGSKSIMQLTSWPPNGEWPRLLQKQGGIDVQQAGLVFTTNTQ